MKKWGTSLAALLIGCTALSSVGTAAAPAKPVTVMLDDVVLKFGDAEPEITKDYTFVPFRALGEALGIEILWNHDTRTITAEQEVDGKKRTVVLQVDQTVAKVDDRSVKLPAAPYIKHNRTLIPLSFFSTQFGAKVGWDGDTRTVSIVSPVREMHFRGFYAISSFAERNLIAEMNSVAFGWVRVDENGKLTTGGKDFYWPQPSGSVTPESIVQDAAAAGTDPYLMVYASDSQGELTRMLSDPSLRSQSIDHIAERVKEKGFSGVLLDFEGLGFKLDAKRQQQILNEYVRLLDEKLKPEGVPISLAVPPPNSVYKGYDYAALAKRAEDLVVMAYEYHPAGTPSHTPQPNEKVDEAIQAMMASGVPRDKIMLGIDIWSETPQSIDDKLGLAKRYGLKGAAFWRIGLFSYYGREMTDAISRSAVKIDE